MKLITDSKHYDNHNRYFKSITDTGESDSELVKIFETDKKANDVINIIDYINNRIQTKITNVSVDTWSETFETDWKRNTDYSNPICAVFLVSKGSATINIDNREYELNQGEICIVNEWCNHKLINKTTSPLTMLLAQFKWDKEVHGK